MALSPGGKPDINSEIFNSSPEITGRMPARPYRILHADLPFCSDQECKSKVEGASLVVLRSEDPKQQHQVQECMPTRKTYQPGQLVQWDLNNKKIWQDSWYCNPETGKTEKAWTQAVEFVGKVIKTT
jgi:hypothetical protein